MHRYSAAHTRGPVCPHLSSSRDFTIRPQGQENARREGLRGAPDPVPAAAGLLPGTAGLPPSLPPLRAAPQPRKQVPGTRILKLHISHHSQSSPVLLSPGWVYCGHLGTCHGPVGQQVAPRFLLQVNRFPWRSWAEAGTSGRQGPAQQCARQASPSPAPRQGAPHTLTPFNSKKAPVGRAVS